MSKLLKKARLTLSSKHSCASASTKKKFKLRSGPVEKQLLAVDVRVFIICLGSRAKKNPPRRAKGLEEQGALI
jgi:hypothetical protein